VNRIFIGGLVLVGCGQDYNLKGGEREEAPDLDPGPSVTSTSVDTPQTEEPPPATSAGEAAPPVAVCDVSPNPVAALYEEATWIGSGSYDPEGRPLTYQWTLIEVPPGANPDPPVGGPHEPDRPGFLPDLVGIYVGELIVTNDLGVSSEPCEVELEAVPGTDLWVEMYWAERGDDMDLHVVRGNGNLRTNQDCYYQNCRFWNPDWGPPGPPADPALDIDDIPGRGPENINIHEPEEITYEVFVHDYPGSRYQQPNDVTVNIYLSGVLAWTDTRPIAGEDDDVHFATVDWAAGTVTPR
jgi:hypothetical protein